MPQPTNVINQWNSSEFEALYLSFDSHLETICSKLYKGTYFKHNLGSMYKFKSSLQKFFERWSIEICSLSKKIAVVEYFVLIIKRLV